MYRVIKLFADLQDKNHEYHVGDTFPRDGLEVSKERIEELSGSNNKQHAPLIEKVAEEESAELAKEETETEIKKPARATRKKESAE